MLHMLHAWLLLQIIHKDKTVILLSISIFLINGVTT